MSKQAVKIIVVGAGIVGNVQSLLLARAGYAVTLIDNGSAALVQADGLNVRSVALSRRSSELLAEQQLWPENTGCLIKSVHVTERGKYGAVRLRSEDLDVPSLGVVIQNHLLERYLMAQVKNQPNIQLLQPASAEVVENSPDAVTVQVVSDAGSIEITAALLVAADGTHSKIRQSVGIKSTSTDYLQHAIVANLQCQRDHQNIAYERFTDGGPLALLPLAKRQMAMVLTADSAVADRWIEKTDADFLTLIQQRFGGRLGRFEAVGRRAMFPLALHESRSQMKDRVVLVGNSARTLHPVAGQGLNLALRDVFELGARLSACVDIGESLAEFVTQRTADQRLVVRQTDVLARVFRRQPWPLSVPLGLFRTSSMLLLDTVPPLRTRFGSASSGLNVPLSNFVPRQSSGSQKINSST